MKKIFLIPLLLLACGCNDYDDFSFTGKVVDYEMCDGLQSFGYAVTLTSPDTIGKDFVTREGVTYHHVVMCYRADRMLHPNQNISGKIYLDPNYSKTECNYHFDRDIPEAVFTKLRIEN